MYPRRALCLLPGVWIFSLYYVSSLGSPSLIIPLEKSEVLGRHFSTLTYDYGFKLTFAPILIFRHEIVSSIVNGY